MTIDQARYQADDELARANVERAKASLDLMRDLDERAERAGPGRLARRIGPKRAATLSIAEAEYSSGIAAFARAATIWNDRASAPPTPAASTSG